MAIDRKLIVTDRQGNEQEYDILAKDVKFQPDGKDLPTKLAEMEQEIEDAASSGYAPPPGGIPKTDLSSDVQTSLGLADTALQSADIANLATKTELSTGLAGKVDKITGKGLSTNDFTNAEKTKLAGIAAGAQVNVINGIQTHDGTPLTPQNGIVTLPEQTEVDLSDYYDKDEVDDAIADKLSNVIINNIPAGSVAIINDTTTGGIANAWSAQMGKELSERVDELGYDVITTQHTQSLEVDSQNTGTVNSDAASQTCEIDWDVPQSGVPAFVNVAQYPANTSVPSTTPRTGQYVTIFAAMTGDYANGGAKANHVLLRCFTFTTSDTITLVAKYYFVINESTQEVTDMSASQQSMSLAAGTYTVLSYGDLPFGIRPHLQDNTGSVDVASAFAVDLTDTYGSGNEPAKADVVDLFGDIRLGSSDSSYTPAGSSAVLSVTRGGTVVATATYGTDTTITVQGGDVLSLSGNGTVSIDVGYTTTERQKRANVWTNQAASLLAVVLQHVTFDDASTGQAAASALITLLTSQNQQS